MCPQLVAQRFALKIMMKRIFFLLAGVLIFSYARAQGIQIELGPDEIGQNQAWTITVTVNNDRLKNYDNFPDIEGFQKRGTSSSSQTNIINGQMSSSQSIIMTYVPLRQGMVTVPSFKMKVNDQLFSVNGKKIRVGPPVQVQQTDPFRSFFDRDPADFFGRSQPTEFVDIKEDALLALTTNKDEVYVGEGFTATLSFLIADNNRAPMQFHDLGKQLSEILKKLRPGNCWEENFNIENIEGEPIQVGNKRYTQYKIYQAAFFPLNSQPVIFPSIGLEMIKFKVAKNPSFFGQNRQEDFKTFYSKTKTIKVKELPPHPLRDAVAVGKYKLDERINRTQLQTGQSVSYDFNVYGEGNISSIAKPNVDKNAAFDFYEPNVKQNITREAGRVAGTKSFSYFMIPKEPGTYKLGDYFQWVFFNPEAKKYDTLKSQQVVNVMGESYKNQSIGSNDLGSFYDRIDAADNTFRTNTTGRWIKYSVNLFTLLIVGLSIYLIYSKSPAVREATPYNSNFKKSTMIGKKEPKKINIKAIIGIVVGVGSFTLAQQLFFKAPSFDKIMMSAANEINKSCPLMVDQETRLDNTIALPDNRFQYNYTLVNFEKQSLNIEELKEKLKPTIINIVKTNPQMKIMREKAVTVVYSYKDKNGVFLFEIVVTPDQYKEN